LGRPPAEKEKQRDRQLQTRQDELDRIPIEGKFGQGKRRFSLSRIMCKLAETSETAIMIAFLVMNLEKWLKGHLFALFLLSKSRFLRHVGSLLALLTAPTGLSWLNSYILKSTWRMNFAKI